MSDNVVFDSRRPVESFRYPAVQAGMPFAPGVAGAPAGDYKARDLALQQEIAQAVEAARKQGLLEGSAQASAAAAKAIDEERSAVAQAVHDFVLRQKNYFRQLETEAVRLALNIARKILRREAQMDPLLLAGVVRVALEGMQSGTRLVLRTSPESARAWAEFCAQQPAGDCAVEVVPDGSLKNHQCILETESGRTEISLDGQLGEIESGFFDLLQAQAGGDDE